jgi:hypothetical protein
VTWRRSASGGLWRQGLARPIGPLLRPSRRQLRYGAHKPLAVPERQTQFFEVRIGEVRENSTVDIGPDESFAVLAKPEPFQQLPDSFHRAAPQVRKYLN